MKSLVAEKCSEPHRRDSLRSEAAHSNLYRLHPVADDFRDDPSAVGGRGVSSVRSIDHRYRNPEASWRRPCAELHSSPLATIVTPLLRLVRKSVPRASTLSQGRSPSTSKVISRYFSRERWGRSSPGDRQQGLLLVVEPLPPDLESGPVRRSRR